MVQRVVFTVIALVLIFAHDCKGGKCWLSCAWLPWKNWSQCTRTCAGGTQYRTREICCLPHFNNVNRCLSFCRKNKRDMTDTRPCNNFCKNGGTLRGNYCDCPNEYYNGLCCEKVCPLIDYCIHRSCTNARNVQCTRCQGVVKDNPGFRAYVLSKNNKACIQACSWRSDSKWCYPGTCDNEYATNCNCSDGFTGPNCVTMEDPPSIEYNELVLNKDTPDEKSIPDDVNEWPVKTPSWTNMQNITTMEYDFRATYKPGYKLPEKHAFIKEYHVGITNGTVELNFYPQKENQTGYSELYICGNATVKNPEKNTLKCYNDNLNVSSIIPPTLNTGDMLELLFNTENGGFVEVEDKELSSITEHFYEGHRKQSVIRLGFDYIEPYHCVEEGCTTQTLNVPKAALVSNPNISWNGWNDNTSGLAFYDIEVSQMKYIKAEAGFKKGGRVIQNKTTENTFHLGLSAEGLLSVELTAFDKAGNRKSARRIMIYDKTSAIETRINTTLLVTTASSLSGYHWQWTSGSISIEWTHRYINTRHISNHWLERVLPQPEIDSDYDDQGYSRGLEKIDNIQGIVRFETSFRVDHNGGKGIKFPGNFTSLRLNQSQVLTPSLVDGDTLRYWIRAYDIRDEFLEENVTVHIDTSPPVVTNLWLTREDRVNISVHRIEELNQMTIEWESYDEHSGLETVTWRLFDNYTGDEILHGKEHINSQGNTEDETECLVKYGNFLRGAQCYCTPGNGCYHRHFQVKPSIVHANLSHGGIFHNISAGVHDSDYFLEVTVMNHAKLTTVLTKKITIDVSPPQVGVVHDGQAGEPEVDFQDVMQLHVHWEGFFDKESGVLFYQYKFDQDCLQASDFGYDVDDKNISETYTTHASWMAPKPGNYYVTVVGYNRALEPSDPVCSDGVTVDTSTPVLSELAVDSSHTLPGLVKTAAGSVWFIDSQRRRTKVIKPSTVCRNKATDITQHQLLMYPVHRSLNGSEKSLLSTKCPDLDKYAVPIEKFYISREHWLHVNWTSYDNESGIYDYQVGLMSMLSNKDSPDISPYTSTNHHLHYQDYHAGLSDGQQFYIAVKAINKAGLSTTKILGPIIMHTQAPVFSSSFSVLLEKDFLVATWTKDTFNDPAKSHLRYEVAVGSTAGGSELRPYKPLEVAGVCNLTGTVLCASIPLNSLHWSLHHSYTYYVSVKATNIVGLSTVGTSEPYTHSVRLPSPGVVFDVSPVEEQELFDITDLEDSDFQMSTTTLQARWYGFEDGLSDVTYEACMGSAPGLQDVRSFANVGQNESHQFRNLRLLINKRYYVTVLAKTNAGERRMSSDGVIILKRNEELTALRIHDGQECGELAHHQAPYNVCEATSVYQISTSSYQARWDEDETVKARFPDVYWSLEKKYVGSDDLWYAVRSYELTSPKGKVIVGGLSLYPGRTYRSNFKFCAGQICSLPVYSSGITVIPHPPKAGTMNITYTENSTEIFVLMSKFHDLDIPDMQEAYNVMSRYEWSITDNSHSSRLLNGWHTVDNINMEGNKKISFTLQLLKPITFTKCRRLAVRGFNKLGLYSVISADIRNCSAYDPKNIQPNVVIDAFGLPTDSKDLGFGIHLDLNDKWTNSDMDYTPYKNVISAVWPTLRHHDYTWAVISDGRLTTPPHYKRENIMTLSDPCSIPGVISCGMTDTEYVNIWFNSTDYLTHGRRYYVCIHADARDVKYEKWTTLLEEVNTCSDGITVDLTPPSPGEVMLAGLIQGKYQLSRTEIKVRWSGFTDVEEERATPHTSGISHYQIAAGSVPDGEDIQTFTHVGYVNHTTLSGLSLHDGNIVYVMVKAFDYVNNTVRVISEPFTIDTTPPVKSTRQIYVQERYITSTIVSACWNGVLVDKESGMISYDVSLGSRPGYDDIAKPVSTPETCMTFDLGTKVKDGHSFYISLKGYNGIGQHSLQFSRKLMVDTTPPSVGFVYDGKYVMNVTKTNDQDYVTSLLEMGAHWEGFHDPQSTVKDFKVKVGTCSGCEDILKEYNVGVMSDIDFVALSPRFVKGVKYFTTVTCCNMADLCVSATSDGVLIDPTPPVPGTVSDGTKDMDIQYQAPRTFLGCKWRGFQDPESDLDHYEWHVGTAPGRDDILESRRASLDEVVFSSLQPSETLPVGQKLYCTVRAVNKAGLHIEVSSNGFVVDDTPPDIVTAPTFDTYGTLMPDTLFSRSVIKVKWEFSDMESHIERQFVSISSHLLGEFNASLLEVPGFLKEYTFTNLALHDGSKYQVKVAACNMASLCTSSSTKEILLDSTKPVSGTFAVETDHAAVLSRHRSGWMTWNDSSLSLAWLGFADLHSGIGYYIVSVGLSPFATDLTGEANGVKVYHENHTSMDEGDEGFVQTHVIHTKNLSGHNSVFVTVWAVNGVGLESQPLHGELHLGDGGQLELIRRCDEYNCEGHCVCAAQDKKCSRSKGCRQIAQTDSLIVYDVDKVQIGEDIREIDYTPSKTFLAATWIVKETSTPPIRYEYSVGKSKSDDPQHMFDVSTQRVWFDAGTKTFALFSFERGRELHQDSTYSFFVRAWYNNSCYGIFKSNGVTIDARPPTLTNLLGFGVKEHINESLGKDVDYQSFTDRIYLSWKDKFNSGAEILKYRTFISTTPGGHSIHGSEDLTTTYYTATGLNLEPGTIYYSSVLAYNAAGLVSWAFSDGVQVDLSPPHMGLVQDGNGLHNMEFQSSVMTISASWQGFSDKAIVHYFWCVGRSNDTTDCNVVSWRNVGLHTSYKANITTTVPSGTKLWNKVYAVDAVGHDSEVVVSDGVVIDTSPPQAVDVVYLGENLVLNPSFEEHPASSNTTETNCNSELPTSWQTEVDSCITIRKPDVPVAKHGMSFVSVRGTIKQMIRNLEPGSSYQVTIHIGYPQGTSHKQRAVEGFVSFGTHRFTFSLDPHVCAGICSAGGQELVKWSTHTYTIESDSDSTDLVIGTSTKDMEMIVDHARVHAVHYTSRSMGIIERKNHITVHPVFLPHWSTLHFTWHFMDTESPIIEYQWALGTVKHGTQIQPFVKTGRQSHGTLNSVHLTHNQKLYLTVTATNAAGLTTVSNSEPITVDFTPPVFKWIHDGENGDDKDYQESRTIAVSWVVEDEETEVSHCVWAVGTVRGTGNFKQFERIEAGKSSASYDLTSDLNITRLTLYSTVLCSNKAGLAAVAITDGVTVSSDTQTQSSEVEILEENSLLYHKQGLCHTEEILRLKWTREEHLHNVVQTKDAKTVSQTTIPTRFEYAKLYGFIFEPVSKYSLKVYPESETEIKGLVTVHNFTFRGAPPQIKDSQRLGMTKSEKHVTLSWKGLFSSPWSDLQFEVRVGTVMGGADLVGEVYTRKSELELLMDGKDETEIYVSISAIDPCGFSAHYNEKLQF